MRPIRLLAGVLAMLGLGCRHTLPVPLLDRTPEADGRLEDWHGQPRAWWADGALGGAAAWDGERLGLLLELRDPSWERAFRQGLVEVRLGGDDPRGRRRVLAVRRNEMPRLAGEVPGAAPGHADPLQAWAAPPVAPPPQFLWILRGQDYHDERRLPLADGGPQVAWGRLPEGQGGFLEVVLPWDEVHRPGGGDHLDLELARSPVPGGGVARGGVEPPDPARGEGPGGEAGHRHHRGGPAGGGPGAGGRDGGMAGGRGAGPGEGPGRGPVDHRDHASRAGGGFEPGIAGLPLLLRLRLDGRE